MARKSKCSSFPLNLFEKAHDRQVYAAGRRRGKLGCCDNPYPAGTRDYTLWANGNAVGEAERVR